MDFLGRELPGNPQRHAHRCGLMLTLLLFAGCVGTVSDFPGRYDPSDTSDPSDQSDQSDPDVIVDRQKVTLPLAPLKLLPFDVRLRRTAVAVGIPENDPVFDGARGQRLALGAHDFANGTAPDLQWNSQRMSGWIAAMLPVCRDTRVRTRFGTWKQGGVDMFAQSAFGRASTDDDLSDLSAVLAVTGDDGWVATCLALVSSAEMVLQ